MKNKIKKFIGLFKSQLKEPSVVLISKTLGKGSVKGYSIRLLDRNFNQYFIIFSESFENIMKYSQQFSGFHIESQDYFIISDIEFRYSKII